MNGFVPAINNSASKVREVSEENQVWQEEFQQNCPEVVFPEELNHDSDLLLSKDLIIVSFCEKLEEVFGIFFREDPVEVQQSDVHSLQTFVLFFDISADLKVIYIVRFGKTMLDVFNLVL